jgi:hypothetical protein
MSSKEGTPLQQDMFTGDWKDNRTRTQRKSDRERSKLQQASMFAFEETYEFGASYRPWLKDAPAGTLQLEHEDIRTPEEIEDDLIREANSHSQDMFEPVPPSAPPESNQHVDTPAPQPSLTNASQLLSVMGLRKYNRRQHVKLRTRS